MTSTFAQFEIPYHAGQKNGASRSVLRFITLQNVTRFSEFLQCWEENEISNKTCIRKISPHLKCVAVLLRYPVKCKRSKITQIVHKLQQSYHVKVPHMFNHFVTKFAQNPSLTYTEAHRCVCHLLNAGRVIYFSA